MGQKDKGAERSLKDRATRDQGTEGGEGRGQIDSNIARTMLILESLWLC